MGNVFNIILIQPIVNLLFTIYGFIPGHDFGLSIIILTILIRFALWPLAGKQLHSQKKMQAIQKDIAKIRTQADGDKQKESQMLMELYKEKEVNPFSACLPALLQFPILIAMFIVFQQATKSVDQVSNLLYAPVKNISYISQVLTNSDLFQPYLLNIISMTKPSALLAILAGLTQFLQVKMITPSQQPKQNNQKDPQAQMNSMMTMVFPVLTVFIAWGLPAALPLYWIVTNLISMSQQYLTARHEVEVMEEAEVVTIKKKITNTKTKKSSKPKKKKK